MSQVLKIQLETAGGDVGTITIARPRADLERARVVAVFGQFSGAAALRHRGSSGDAYTTVKSAKYVTETELT